MHNPLEWVDPLGLAGCSLKKSVRSDCDYELDVDSSVYPQTAGHIQDAINSGHPFIVTIDRSHAKSNRAKSLKGFKTQPKLDRDEWPMAMFKEGGDGASVRLTRQTIEVQDQVLVMHCPTYRMELKFFLGLTDNDQRIYC